MRTERRIEKKILREQMRGKRLALSEEEICSSSCSICRQVLDSAVFERTNIVIGYMPVRGEVSDLPILMEALRLGKKVYLPKISGKNMDFFETSDLGSLKKGAFGIPEPEQDRPLREEEGLMLVPGTAFDENCFRLGYGGGYYDRYLAVHTGFCTVGLSYEFQLVQKLPAEGADIGLWAVVTEKRRIIKGRKRNHG